jgi:hypothetical protein
MASDASRFYPPAEMTWSERRAADQRHFAATKDAATERILRTPPAPEPAPFAFSAVCGGCGQPITGTPPVVVATGSYHRTCAPALSFHAAQRALSRVLTASGVDHTAADVTLRHRGTD